MCPDCGKPKMLFDTEKKALDFIRWNSMEISGGEKLHPYYCNACCGWHITHVEHRSEYDTRMDERISVYKKSDQGRKWQNYLKRIERKGNKTSQTKKYRKIHNPKF